MDLVTLLSLSLQQGSGDADAAFAAFVLEQRRNCVNFGNFERFSEWFDWALELAGVAFGETRVPQGKSSEKDVRLLAVITLRQMIETLPSSCTFEMPSRKRMREVLLEASHGNRLSQTDADAIGALAKVDWPANLWPALFPNLLVMARSRQGSLAMYRVLKALNSRRLPAEKASFRKLANDLFHPLHEIWASAKDFYVLLYLTKALKILTLHGCAEDEMASREQPRSFLQHLCTRKFSSHLIKIRCNVSKFALQCQEQKPLGFLPFLPSFLEKSFSETIEMIEGYCEVFFHPTSCSFDEKVAVPNLNLLSNSLNCTEYKNIDRLRGRRLITAEGDIEIPEDFRVSVLESFWTNEKVETICRAIVLHGLMLSREELELWVNAPEEFAMRDEGASIATSFRAACENHLLALMDSFPEPASCVLLQCLSQVEDQRLEIEGLKVHSKQEFPEYGIHGASLFRDSCLRAIGISTYWLHQLLPFDEWMEKSLLPRLAESRGDNVIRFRILWLIGCIPSESYSAMRPELCEFLINLVGNDNEDLVIRLEAAKALQNVVEAFDFDVNQFIPMQTSAINAIFVLGGNCEENETHLQLVLILSTFVRRAKSRIAFSLNELLEPLNRQWSACQGPDWSMWKISVLNLLQSIIEQMSDVESLPKYFERESMISQLQHLVVPVIKTCTDKHNVDFVYLFDPAVQLWATAIKSTLRVYSVDLHELLECVPLLVEATLAEGGLFQTLMEICETHLMHINEAPNASLLSAHIFRPVLDEFLFQASHNDDKRIRVLSFMELLFRTPNHDCFGVLRRHVEFLVMQICKTGNSRMSDSLLCAHLNVIARAMLTFGTGKVQEVIGTLLDRREVNLSFLKAYSVLGGAAPQNIWRRKLLCLILLSEMSFSFQNMKFIIAQDEEEYQQRLNEICGIWADVRADLITPAQKEAAIKRVLDNSCDGFILHQLKKRNFLADPVVQLDIDEMMKIALRSAPREAVLTFVENDPVLKGILF